MEAVDVRGRFVWHQLMTRDVPGARKFYSELVGWKTMPWPLDPAYTVCHADAGPVAGIMEIPSSAPAAVPAHWLQYIGTPDVDATADAAVRAGGSVMKSPESMQGAGRYAVLKDPQGAVFAVITPETARPDDPGAPPLGAFSWHELATTDNEAAFAFYRELFGWDALQRMDMGPAGAYLIFGQGGQQRGGIYIKPADWDAPPNWLPYAHVPSADGGFAFATSAGSRQLVAPMDVPGGGRIATFMDPAGAPFAIHSRVAVIAVATDSAATPAEPKAKAKAKPKARPKAKVKAKPKAKAKTKAKVRTKTRSRPAAKRKASRKPAARKKVARRVARKSHAKRRPAKKAARRKK
jgi:predicted enzyme related to lactoylglutathione lyase